MLVMALVLAGAVWTRLAYWQVAQHGQLAMQAQAQYREFVELPALRGAVFDRNLTQLVVNTTVYSAFVSPDQVSAAQRDTVASGLASVLGVDRAQVMDILESKSTSPGGRPNPSDHQASSPLAGKVARAKRPAGWGLTLSQNYQRMKFTS